jgi:hypothetical protein
MRLFCSILLTAAIFIFAGCSAGIPSPTEEISEISLTKQTGLLGVTYTITFRRDSTASGECTFYNLDQNNKPGNLEYSEPFCKDLYFKYPAAFLETKNSYNDIHLKGSFSGNISKEKFEKITELVDKNGFSSMENEYVELAIDAPPDHTKVIYVSGRTRQVSDNLDNGGEKLAEIKRTIFNAAKETKWESGRK